LKESKRFEIPMTKTSSKRSSKKRNSIDTSTTTTLSILASTSSSSLSSPPNNNQFNKYKRQKLSNSTELSYDSSTFMKTPFDFGTTTNENSLSTCSPNTELTNWSPTSSSQTPIASTSYFTAASPTLSPSSPPTFAFTGPNINNNNQLFQRSNSNCLFFSDSSPNMSPSNDLTMSPSNDWCDESQKIVYSPSVTIESSSHSSNKIIQNEEEEEEEKKESYDSNILTKQLNSPNNKLEMTTSNEVILSNKTNEDVETMSTSTTTTTASKMSLTNSIIIPALNQYDQLNIETINRTEACVFYILSQLSHGEKPSVHLMNKFDLIMECLLVYLKNATVRNPRALRILNSNLNYLYLLFNF
jgi:epidermal growth factor receptor substrate 15